MTFPRNRDFLFKRLRDASEVVGQAFNLRKGIAQWDAHARRQEAAATDDTKLTEDTVLEPTTAPDTSFNPQEFDPALKQQAAAIVQEIADATKPPENELPANGFAAKHASGRHLPTNPSSKRRESLYAAAVRKLPGTLTVMAGDVAVRLIDKGDEPRGYRHPRRGGAADTGRSLTEDREGHHPQAREG